MNWPLIEFESARGRGSLAEPNPQEWIGFIRQRLPTPSSCSLFMTMSYSSILRATSVVALFVLAAAGLPAMEQPPKDSIDRDYAGELPRIPAKEPAEALKTFQVAPGFR